MISLLQIENVSILKKKKKIWLNYFIGKKIINLHALLHDVVLVKKNINLNKFLKIRFYFKFFV